MITFNLRLRMDDEKIRAALKERLATMAEKHVPFLNDYIEKNRDDPHYERINKIRLMFIGKLDP